jgi:hypothetical protein
MNEWILTPSGPQLVQIQDTVVNGALRLRERHGDP